MSNVDRFGSCCWKAIGPAVCFVMLAAPMFAAEYKGPCDVAASPDGAMLYVVEKDAQSLAAVDSASGKVIDEVQTPGKPTSVCVTPGGVSLLVTCGVADGQLCVLSAKSRDIMAQIPVGHSPRGVSVTPDGKKAFVCNRFNNDVSVIDLLENKEVARVKCLREPYESAVTPDGKSVFVTNHLPLDAADSFDVSCEVTCIDTATLEAKNIRLLNGVTDLSGVCVSPDGKYAYVVSILARYQMPTTQLERGWMNTNALSVIDVEKKEYVNSVLLDDIDLGAANPYDVATSADGSTIYVTHSGTHEVSVIDANAMLERLLSLPADMAALEAAGIEYDPNSSYASVTAEDVPNDLAFLVDMRDRLSLEGVGPRGMAVVGDKVYCTMYFSDTLDCLDLDGDPVPTVSTIALGPKPELTLERQGEINFHDAALCFQAWQSCVSCHPDARVDSLNWDLMNDGLGNPKNVKSMLLAHETPPAMISGVRGDAETAVRAGIRFIQFAVRPESDAVAIDAYLKSLKPVPSPHLVDGELSEAAVRGKALFESDEVGCAVCHPAPLYTDMELHDVNTRGRYDRRDTWDTPTLIECWRTGPYLHDGRYVTMRGLLVEGDHGEASDKLNGAQMNDLIEFVLSL